MKRLKSLFLVVNLLVMVACAQGEDERIVYDAYTVKDGSYVSGSVVVDLYLEFLEDNKEAGLGGMTALQIEQKFLLWLSQKLEKEGSGNDGT